MEIKLYDLTQKLGDGEKRITLAFKDKAGTVSYGDWVHIDEVTAIAQLYADVVGLNLTLIEELRKRGHILRVSQPEKPEEEKDEQ